MKKLALILAPLALALPVVAAHGPARAEQDLTPRPVLALDPAVSARPEATLEESLRPRSNQQVRIEQRVIIRITPGPDETRNSLIDNLPRRPLRSDYEEVQHDRCVRVSDIVGVQPARGNKLLLFTRDRSVLAASLANNCSARSFYSGFYVERSSDGRLCASRDRLQSRAGASCEVSGMSRLVAVRD